MKKSVLQIAFALCTIININAQSKFNVNGTIIEKGTSEAIMSATVQLLSLPDSSFVTGTATSTTGEFELKDVKKDHYALKISYIGYVTKVLDIDLNKEKSRKVSLGYITMSSDAIMLQAAQVTANAAKVQVSGDSLVYNASAYRTPEGSTLEALIRQLPGAKVDKDGNITINGKSVSKILVDGKEFFLNDKSVAMKNIPTEMIERIKSYERKSDLARVTGIDDGEEETVLDLSVKKGMKNGWFGNVNLGAGTKHRYNERFNINRFNDDAQYTLLGGANNIADQGFGGGGGRWGGWGGGLRANKEIGGNFATTSTKLETGGSVRYRYDGTDNENASSTENFNAQIGKFGESRSKSLSSGNNLFMNFRLEWKPDTMTNIIFRPNLRYSRNRSMSNSMSGSYNDDPNSFTSDALDYNHKIASVSNGTPADPADVILNNLLGIVVNTNTSNNQNYSTNSNFNGEFQFNRKLNSTGRNITLRITGGFNDGRNKQLSAANVTYNTLDSTQQNNRYYNTPSKGHNINAQLTYSEPIADRTYLQFSYQYQYSYSRNDRRAQIYDSQAYQDLANSLINNRYNINAVLKFMEEANHMLTDDSRLSQFSEYKNNNQVINVNLRKVRDEYNFSVGIDLLPQHSALNYKYMGHEYPKVTRTVFNYAPRLNLRVNFDKQTNLNVRYNGRTSQPSMTNLLDIVDDADPLNISRGNKNLKPSFSHNVNVNFNTYNADLQQGIYTWTWFNATQNSISNKTTYDNNGVRTTMPMNINGNWGAGGGFGFNTGLGADKAFNVGADLGGNYNRNVGFYNNVMSGSLDNADIKSITNQVGIFGGLEFSYRNEQISIELNGNIDHSHSKNNVNAMGNQNTFDFNYGGEFEWTSPWGTSLSTDIGMSSRRGYAQREANTNELLWNAQVSQSFLKGKALSIVLSVNDILHQQTNISRNISALMRSDSRHNAIYQYAMLKVIYKFSIFAGKNTMGTDDERSADGGGRRGGWGGW